MSTKLTIQKTAWFTRKPVTHREHSSLINAATVQTGRALIVTPKVTLWDRIVALWNWTV